MCSFTEKDYIDYGFDQQMRLEEGFTPDDLVGFEHEGVMIVNPYSDDVVDPTELFGVDKMEAWKAECRELWQHFAADQ